MLQAQRWPQVTRSSSLWSVSSRSSRGSFRLQSLWAPPDGDEPAAGEEVEDDGVSLDWNRDEEEESPWNAATARTVGSFRLLGKILGSGSYATVELCADCGGTQHAVKVFEKAVLKRRWDLRPGCRQSLLSKAYREIEVLRALGEHRHIVKFAATVEDADRLFVFLELCVGPVMSYDDDAARFACRVTGHACGSTRSARYVGQIAQALQHAHSRGVSHRDLKPENVLLTHDGDCRLADFGEASLERRVSCHVGTQAYWAPEMLSSEVFDAPECDLWALGVCCFNFLTTTFPDSRNPILLDEPDAARLIARLLDRDVPRRATPSDVLDDGWITLALHNPPAK